MTVKKSKFIKGLNLKLAIISVLLLIGFFSVTSQVFAAGSSYSACDLLGQLDISGDPVFTTGDYDNNEVTTPNERGLAQPTAIAMDSLHHRLFVSDNSNHRVLVYNLDSNNQLIDHEADHVLGQADFNSDDTDTTASSMDRPGDIAYDPSTDRLFVVDKNNVRVLVFDVTSITDGEDAVHVLGQTDFFSANDSQFEGPHSLALDSSGQRLFVSDGYDAFVYVFDTASIIDGESPINILGRSDLDRNAPFVATPENSFGDTVGLAFDPNSNRLFVADPGNARVMVFDVTSITNGEDAVNVLLQPDFNANTPSTTQSGMTSPYGLAYDPTNNFLFVSDDSDSRVLVFDASSITNGEDAVNVLGQSDYTSSASDSIAINTLAYPEGIAWLSATNQLFIADHDNNRIMVYCFATATTDHSITWTTDGDFDHNEVVSGDPTTQTSVLIGSDQVKLSLTDVKGIAVNDSSNLAIKNDGTLWAWGYNGYGQLGLGDTDDRYSPTQIGTDTDWMFVSEGLDFSIAIKTDGTIWGWGANGNGQLGLGDGDDRDVPTQIGTDTDWKEVNAGYINTLALKTDGTIWGWGYNSDGELGLNDTDNRDVPTQIGTDSDWKVIDNGDYHSVAVKNNGTLWSWGWNAESALGLGADTDDKFVPTQVGSDTDWDTISVGDDQTLALKTNGTLWAWGVNWYGSLGTGDPSDLDAPTQVGTDSDWVKIRAGSPTSDDDQNSFAIKSDGTLWAWGYNGGSIGGELGLGDSNDRDVPTKVGTDTDWYDVAAEHTHTLGLRQDGTLWSWGDNSDGQLGNGVSTSYLTPTEISANTNWQSISAGNGHTVAIKSDGTLWFWGTGGNTLGAGNLPSQIGTDTDWQSISAGDGFTLAIKSDGTLWSWGYNGSVQLGFADSDTRDVPTQVGIDTDWQSVADGVAHSVALKTNGTLWGWGQDIGLEPSQIDVDSDWQSVSAGNNFSIAIKTDGTLWGFGGNNAEGEIGVGDTSAHYAPIQIGVATNWQSVSVGNLHTLATKTDGTLWSWGYNGYGALGSNDIVDLHTPTQVGTDTDWQNIAAGGGHSLATKTDGTLWSWGTSVYGALGQNDTVTSLVPAQVGVDADWQELAGGSEFSIATKSDNTIWGFGGNNFGALGLYDYFVPIQVGASTDWWTSAQYSSSGEISGFIKNMGSGNQADWEDITWDSVALPAGTTIRFRARTSDDGVIWSGWSAYTIQNSTGSAYGSADISALGFSQYLEMNLYLSTDAPFHETPTLNDFSVGYNDHDVGGGGGGGGGGGSGPGVVSPVISVDLKVNNSDGTATVNYPAPYVYSWTSANATSCQLTSPTQSTLALSGSSAPITMDNAFYVLPGHPVTLTISCSNGSSTAVDSVVINSVVPPSENGNLNIFAASIVCSSQSDLPNWTRSQININQTTAGNFIATHPQCHLGNNSKFQIRTWGQVNNPSFIFDSQHDPGSPSNTPNPGPFFVGEASSPWVTVNMPVTLNVNNLWHVFVREVLGDGYTPQLYCDHNMLDGNFARLDGPFHDRQNLYCVSVNVVEEIIEPVPPIIIEPPVLPTTPTTPTTPKPIVEEPQSPPVVSPPGERQPPGEQPPGTENKPEGITEPIPLEGLIQSLRKNPIFQNVGPIALASSLAISQILTPAHSFKVITGATSTSALQIGMLEIFSSFLGALGLRRKKTYWGTVFDSKTKEPIDPVYLSLIDEVTKKEVDTSITDITGRYGFFVKPGNYTITANRSHYFFPSVNLRGKSVDGVYENLYFGQLLHIASASEVIAPNIPMDPIGVDWNQEEKKSRIQVYPKTEAFLNYLSSVIFYIGLAITLCALFLSPRPINYILAVIYITIAIYQLFSTSRLWGRVYERMTGNAASGLTLELFLPTMQNIVIASAVTNQEGKFFMKADEGDYKLKISKAAGENKIPISEFDLKVSSEGLVNEDIKI